jgi:hypothetical protein
MADKDAPRAGYRLLHVVQLHAFFRKAMCLGPAHPHPDALPDREGESKGSPLPGQGDDDSVVIQKNAVQQQGVAPWTVWPRWT